MKEIDKSDIGQVAKFSYLKELLVPRVRATTDGLPFTSEGYARAKNILKTKYGRPSEVANAHIQSIMGLPVITGTNPARICEFYEASDVPGLHGWWELSTIKKIIMGLEKKHIASKVVKRETD